MRRLISGLGARRGVNTLVIFAYAFLLLIVLGLGSPDYL